MKAFVIYDSTGKIWNIIYGENTMPENPKCMEVDIPEGAGINGIDLSKEEPQPMISWKASETKIDAIEEIKSQVDAGGNVKELIANLNLTNAEKWQLEKKVKEALKNGI